MAQMQGTCPICNSTNLTYGTIEITDVGVFYPATCEDCGADFEEHYNLSFAGHYKIHNNKVKPQN